MLGVIFSVIAGVFISLQNVLNTRASEKIGLLGTVTVVHGSGFVVSVILLIILKYKGLSGISEVNKIYLLGGLLGIVIVYSVIKGVALLGATFSVGILLTAQIIASLIIDSFGLFGIDKIQMTITKPLGIFFMIMGILIINIKI